MSFDGAAGATFAARWAELAAIGRRGTGGYRRYA